MKTYLDIETRSRVDLKKAGARRYAADPSTEITVATVAVGDGPFTSYDVLRNPFERALFFSAVASAGTIVAHNIGFDVTVTAAVAERYGVDLPEFTPDRLSCTSARALRLSLPGGLENLGETMGLGGKLAGGSAIVMATCSPRKDGSFDERPELFKQLAEYCIRDGELLRSIDRMLPPLPPEEQAVFERTWWKNAHGLPIDMTLARAIAARKAAIDAANHTRLAEMTDGHVTALSQRARLLKWLHSRGCMLADTRKETLERALPDEPDALAHDVIQLALDGGGSAPKKAQSLVDRCVGSRYMDGTRYFGARSGRGTSVGANVFNIARPSAKYGHRIPEMIEALKAGEGHDLDNVALSDCLRGCVAAPEGYRIIDADLSNIELRLALWYANDAKRLGILADGGDLYMANAIQVMKLPPNAVKKTHPLERQTGKGLTLSGNYGVGKVRYFHQYRKEIPGLTLDMAGMYVAAYREANPLLAGRDGLWRSLDRAMREALDAPGVEVPVAGGKITLIYDGARSLNLRLPSGRVIPHWQPGFDGNGDFTYWRAKGAKYSEQRSYGAAFLQIACQAAARDVITAAEAAVERELPDVAILLDVYDSIVAIAPKDVADERLEQILSIMRRPPAWAPDLPLDAEGYVADRMQK